jgi:nucleotide-binding universal stress UspA family protein
MPWLPKNNVVVPIDFSDNSLAAVDTALELVAAASQVHVIHVLPMLTVADPGVVWEPVDDESRRSHAEDALRQRLADEKYRGVKVEVTIGDPGHEVADYAQQQHAELIVMPSHGRTGIRRLLIGSVAERVVRLAHCPVLVLKQ